MSIDIKDYEEDRPKICSDGTGKFSKSVSRYLGRRNYQPVLDCVFKSDRDGDKGLNYRFGCIDSSGGLTWKKRPEECGTGKLRLLRLGLLVQSSPRMDSQGPQTITFFEDLPPSLRVTINLTEEQRYYKWRKLEETIPLRNLE